MTTISQERIRQLVNDQFERISAELKAEVERLYDRVAKLRVYDVSEICPDTKKYNALIIHCWEHRRDAHCGEALMDADMRKLFRSIIETGNTGKTDV